MELVPLLLHVPQLLVLLRLSQFGLLDGAVGDGVVALQLGQFLAQDLLLGLQDLARMVLRVHLALQGEELVLRTVLIILEPAQYALVIVLHDLDPVALVLVTGLVSIDLILSVFDASLQFFLLIVELVFKRQEVLVEWDTVPEQGLVTTRLILLVDLLVLEELDLRFHGRNLLVKVQDDVLVNGVLLSVGMLPRLQFLHLFGGSSHI